MSLTKFKLNDNIFIVKQFQIANVNCDNKQIT